MSQFTDSLTEVEAAIAALPADAGSFAALSDAELVDVPAALSSVRHLLESREALAAGEIARRSTYDLGYSGLAQKSGFRTPEKLVQHLTGSTGREASKLVRTGVIVHEAEALATAERTGEVPPELTKPWLAPAGRAVASGTLSMEAAEAIRIGLGVPNADISVEVLTGAAAQLVEEVCSGTTALDADRLLDRARALRDELDEAGIADREAARYRARSFKRYRRPDGMTSYSVLADPENAAYLDSIYNALTSPRRGGPRMVDEAAKARDAAIETDPRSTEQLAFDGIMALLRIGTDTDAKTATKNVLSARRPAVRVLTTQKTLDRGNQTSNGSQDGTGTSGTGNGTGGTGTSTGNSTAGTGTSTGSGTGGAGTAGTRERGHGRIEGQPVPVSIETVERIVCESGTIPVIFDNHGQTLDLGREQRLYTTRQRIALAARDGGCRWPTCDNPAEWGEAHHINHWHRDHGNTNVADGILLCRHHHMLLHNNHWNITRDGGDYWLTPPATEDSTRTPRLMPHKSPALGDLQQEQRQEDRDHTSEQEREREHGLEREQARNLQRERDQHHQRTG